MKLAFNRPTDYAANVVTLHRREHDYRDNHHDDRCSGQNPLVFMERTASDSSGTSCVATRFCDENRRTFAKKKSFQTHMNWRTATAASAGRDIGSTIL